jgi:hypothetical protein
MAKEKFAIMYRHDTAKWDGTIIADNHFAAAFGVYLIRVGEATHCCSLTASTWAEFLKNAFVYAGTDDDAAHAALDDGELEQEGSREGDCYLDYVDIKTMDPRFIAETFTVEVGARKYKGGRRSEAYHDAIWEAAREAAAELGQNGGWEAPILYTNTYYEWQAELAAKRRAENRPVLAGGLRGEALPLFAVAAKEQGIDTYEKAREIGWY